MEAFYGWVHSSERFGFVCVCVSIWCLYEIIETISKGVNLFIWKERNAWVTSIKWIDSIDGNRLESRCTLHESVPVCMIYRPKCNCHRWYLAELPVVYIQVSCPLYRLFEFACHCLQLAAVSLWTFARLQIRCFCHLRSAIIIFANKILFLWFWASESVTRRT